MSLRQTAILYFGALNRVAEVMRSHEGPSPKSLDLDENSKPKHIKICRDLCTFCKNDVFVAKKVNMLLTKVFMAIFSLAERLPTSATLALKEI